MFKKLLRFFLIFIFLLTLFPTMIFNPTYLLKPPETEPLMPPPHPHYERIPILMYHVIEDYTGPYEELYVSPQIFSQQMEYLKDQGFNAVTLNSVIEHWQNNSPLPEKPIVLTFDDGYRSIYTQAFPILKQYQFSATLFIYIRKIDTASGLTTQMIQEMAEYGLEIGSHTLTHSDLTKLKESYLIKEIKESKKRLENLTLQEVTTFCYPAGRYNQTVQKYTTETGYLAAVTTKPGVAQEDMDRYALKRIRINRSDRLAGFIQKLKNL